MLNITVVASFIARVSKQVFFGFIYKIKSARLSICTLLLYIHYSILLRNILV